MTYQFTPPPQWLLDAAANAQRYVNSPGVAEAIEAAQRLAPLMKDIQARIDAFEAARSALDHLGASSGVAAILQRHQEAMAALAASPSWPVPTDTELKKTEAALLAHLPETDSEIEEVAQAVAGIESDPKWRKLIVHLATRIKHADQSKLKPRAIVVLVAFVVIFVAGIAPDEVGALALIYAVARDVLKDD